MLLFRIKLMHPQNLIISILWNSERISDFGEFAAVSHFFQKVRKLVESFSWRSFFMANRQLNKLGIVTGVAKSAVASFVRTVANAAASSSFSSLPPNSGTGKKQGLVPYDDDDSSEGEGTTKATASAKSPGKSMPIVSSGTTTQKQPVFIPPSI